MSEQQADFELKTGRTQYTKGQGVIEYAGAIVIAAVLVSLAIFIVPQEVAGMINNITSTAMTYFEEKVPTGEEG